MIAVESLRTEAASKVWYAPRQAWELAQAAYTADQELAGLSKAEVTLTLAVALNALGRFAEVVSLLPDATGCFLAHGRPDQASRCQSETALACLYLGRFDAVSAALTQARDLLAGRDEPLLQAHCDRVEGLFHLEQNRYSEATALLCRAADTFVAAGNLGEAALTWYHLATTLRFVDPQQALSWLDKARQVTVPEDASVHTARCDYALAGIYHELNRYAESLNLYQQARDIFAREGMDFQAAICDLDLGIAHYHLNQYEEALPVYQRARACFAAQGLSSQVARCDLNIAVVDYATGRYNEALAIYQRVAREAEAEGRLLRAARCYTNAGLCYDRLGRYDQALLLHHRARQAFLDAGSPVYAALCQENLAETCRALGRYDQAMTHYQQARATFLLQQLPIYVARCDTHLADLYLAQERLPAARHCLETAHQVCAQAGLTIYQAACERLLAQVAHRQERPEQADAYLQQARSVFAEHEMIVEVALCDLSEGEMRLERGEVQAAQQLLQQAGAVLSPGFPDYAWRVEMGLGRCALARGERRAAWSHCQAATRHVNQGRLILPTERLSSSFFGNRQAVYDQATALALELGETEAALALAEESKASTFLMLIGGRDWWQRSAQTATITPYEQELLAREQQLRRQLNHRRRQLTVQLGEGEPLRGDAPTLSGQRLQELARLSQEYEDTVEQIRLHTTALSPSHLLSPFSLPAFRQLLAARWPGRWAGLAYYWLGSQLVIFYLDADRLVVHRRSLSAYDRFVLRQCSSPEPTYRELVYRGTLRGYTASGNPGQVYRQHLYRLLIPPEVADLSARDLLILSPHGLLHGLPFHALLNHHQPLVEQVPVVYIPGLPALQTLGERATVMAIDKALLCGVSDFGERARPLPSAQRECQVIHDLFGQRGTLLWGKGEGEIKPGATLSTLQAWNDAGRLQDYDLLHFATHTVVETVAPSLSRVLLADGDLTVSEILELRLRARLVTLSGCQGAAGEIEAGDEMMSLARFFFYAGAQAVVASLWEVEDTPTGELMGHFYRRLQAGETIPQALRQAQRAMHEDGFSPYHWAPFLTLGWP